MLRVLLFGLGLGMSLSAGAAAQSLRAVDGPAELPPAGYAANRYVDSRGCVFIRAGYGPNTVWVPQVTRDRKLLCGQAPSLPPEPAAGPAPKPAAAPPAPAGLPAATRPAATVPKGFRPAWNDGRLNPLRGPRSSAGDAAMARIWTDTVPMRLKPDAPDSAGTPGATIRMSSRAPAVRPEPRAGRLIQIGVFARPANAAAALERLRAAHLPVQTRMVGLNGGAATLVLAGPFAPGAELQDALARLRADGFADAFTRH